MIDYGCNTLKINGKKLELMELPAYIYKILLPTDDTIVVFYCVADVKGEFEAVYRNVFAVNMQGEVLWQIEPSSFKYKRRDGTIQRFAFHNLWLTDSGRLMTDDGHLEYEVNLKTGKLGKGELTK